MPEWGDIMDKPKVLPVLPWENVLFPGMLLPLHVSEAQDIALVDWCLDRFGEFGLALENDETENPREVGTIAKIIDYQQQEDEGVTLLVTGEQRYSVCEMVDDNPFIMAVVEPFPFRFETSVQDLEERANQARRLFNRCLRVIASQRGDIQGMLTLPERVDDLGWAIAASLAVPSTERQVLLEKESAALLLQSEILYLESFLAELRG